jgi:aryl-alcohol dehydrogenase-like predicted oxidoreductase
MTFGGARSEGWRAIGALDERTSADLVTRALDAGVTFFDTADAYGFGDAETFLGKALHARRDKAVIATKAAFPLGKGPNDRGLSRGHLLASVEGSLRRLQTDWIDLYQVHTVDRTTPLDETMRTLEDLVRSGKVRYLGSSNHAAWQMMKANGIAAARGWTRFESAQMYYNLAARDVEREVVPFLADQDVALLVWSPLAGGVLTGKYGRDGAAPEGARRAKFQLGPIDWARVGRILDAAEPIAGAHSASVGQIALAWLLRKPHVTSVILGARTMAQLDDNLRAAEIVLSDEDVLALDAASALAPEYPGWYLEQFRDV